MAREMPGDEQSDESLPNAEEHRDGKREEGRKEKRKRVRAIAGPDKDAVGDFERERRRKEKA